MKADITASITNTHLLKKISTRGSEGLNSSFIFLKAPFGVCNTITVLLHFAHMDQTIISK